MVDRLRTIRKGHMCYIKKCYFDVSLLSEQRDITRERGFFLKGMEKNLRSKETVLSSIDKNILSLLKCDKDIIGEVTESSDNHTYLHKTLTLLELVVRRLTMQAVLSCIEEDPHLKHVAGERFTQRNNVVLEGTRGNSFNSSLHHLTNPVVRRRQIARIDNSPRQKRLQNKREKRYTFPTAFRMTHQSYLLEKWAANKLNSFDINNKRQGYTSHETISEEKGVFVPMSFPQRPAADSNGGVGGNGGARGSGVQGNQRVVETRTVYRREKCEEYVVKERRSIMKEVSSL